MKLVIVEKTGKKIIFNVPNTATTTTTAADHQCKIESSVSQ